MLTTCQKLRRVEPNKEGEFSMSENNVKPVETTEEIKITNKEMKSVFWRSLFEMASINYERFQALGFLYAMTPVIKKLYPDKEQRVAAMKRHSEMYNSHPWLISPILGTTIALEEKNANGGNTVEAINNVKVGLMGPFAGIGDSVLWGTLRPLLAGLGAALALQGNFIGPVLFLVLWNICNFGIRYYTLHYGYKAGMSMLKDMKKTNIVQKLSEGASVLGLMVLGVLVAQWVNISTPIQFKTGETVMKLQEVLNGIMPSMLPLIATFIIVKLLRKKITPNKLIIGIFAVALVLSLLGILAVA